MKVKRQKRKSNKEYARMIDELLDRNLGSFTYREKFAGGPSITLAPGSPNRIEYRSWGGRPVLKIYPAIKEMTGDLSLEDRALSLLQELKDEGILPEQFSNSEYLFPDLENDPK